MKRACQKLCLSALAGAAFGLALAAPSQAQPGYYDEGYYAPSGGVIVEAPRRLHDRGWTGAPIERVTLTRSVRFDDLDLRSDWGARALRDRIVNAASTACDELDNAYPATAPDSPNCYRATVRDGMRQARFVIAQARAQ